MIYTRPYGLYLLLTHIYNQQSMQALVFDHHSELTPLFFSSTPHSVQFPSVPELKGRSARGVQSYSIVLEQSLATVDRGLLKEILSNGTSEVIENSVKGLPPKCVSPLLIALQELINEEPKSTRTLCNWISGLVRIHLAIITSNPQNCIIVQRIRKYIAKRTSHRESLTAVLSKWNGPASEGKKIEYRPKFVYKQEIQQPQKKQEHIGAEVLSEFDQDMEFE